MQKIILLVISIFLFFSNALSANNVIQTSYYFDSRDYNTLAIQISNSDLGKGFSVWGFTDLHSEQNNAANRYNFTRSFSEYRLANSAIAEWSGIENLSLELEYNESTPGQKNNILRMGITYKQLLGDLGWLQYRVFPLQTRHDGQLSMTFFIKLIDKLSLSGFMDYNFNASTDNQWVYEPQLNYQMGSNWWLLLEYRHNGFEDSNPTLDGSGYAFGIRYNF